MTGLIFLDTEIVHSLAKVLFQPRWATKTCLAANWLRKLTLYRHFAVLLCTNILIVPLNKIPERFHPKADHSQSNALSIFVI